MMDTTFYEDTARFGRPKGQAMKRPMTLDLDPNNKSQNSKKARVAPAALLTSPDLNMLKLASPELERLIIDHHTDLQPGQCMYPTKPVNDRDQYTSRDFTDALTSLATSTHMNNVLYHQQQPLTIQSDMVNMVNNNNMPSCSTTMVDAYGYNNVPSHHQHHQQQQHQQPLSSINLNCNPMVSSTNMNYGPTTNGYYQHEPLVSIKEEPQTVPCMGGSPPQSPIDMEDQERMKLERKRLRNRIAASKCRRRKLERIARLEDKVAHLKSENSELTNHVTRLRECICQLKEQVLEHIRNGCEILVSNYNTDL